MKLNSGPTLTYTFAYNGLGDRMNLGVNGAVTTYTLDLAAGLTQILVEGAQTYLYGNGRIAQHSVTSTAYFLGDALGSVRQLTDGGGRLALARWYDPYGNLASSRGDAATVYGFTGEWGTTLLDLRARWYAPAYGRFFVRDSWPGAVQMPGTLHPYLYSLSNPVNYTDPSGHSVECGWGDPYCEAGRLDVGRRAIDLAKSLGKQKVRYDQTTQQQRCILKEGGIVNQAYYDAQQINVGPIREWLDENLAPDGRMSPDMPNDHIELSRATAEANAWFVFGWDVGAASITTGGYMYLGLGAITLDPSTAAFGYFLTNFASLAATVTFVDTVATSGIDSNAYRVNATTYGFGWASVASNLPLDLTMAWLQVAYDAYTIDYMYRHPAPR